ncbi:MAG: dihydroorotate dehydrogenase electron transfer subunit [Chlorobiaceae bacterium]
MIKKKSIVDVRATILQNRCISKNVNIITLDCPEIAATAKPGNFVNIKINDTTQPLLRRPFSIHNVQENTIQIMVKSIGCSTTLLCNTGSGTTMMVLGPLGKGFTTSGHNFSTAILISGGIGSAPMLFLEKTLIAKGKKVINLIGSQTKEELLDLGLTNALFATNDGSLGFKGNVVELLQNELPALGNKKILKIFACGPNSMLKALAKFCRENLLSCEVSVESMMGCGIGICYGCSIAIKNPDGEIKTVLLCKEGPTIDAERLVL